MVCTKCMNVLSDVLEIKMREKLGRVNYASVFLTEVIDRDTGERSHHVVMLDRDFNYCCYCGVSIKEEGNIEIMGKVNIDPIKDKELFQLLLSEANEYDEEENDAYNKFNMEIGKDNFDTIAKTYKEEN